jgi:intergrase/recombinase
LGVIAFEALEKVLKLKRRKGADYYLETELVVRSSTAPARKHRSGIVPRDAKQA